ncbi:ATP-dependent DNA helicase UvrD2 [Tenggerimyces flavus]|uniref:DNA 3'-5' helicase n=1 Tax=Tenggerimyces flavus TaxID=1708749 RepID=A0ABV7YFR5_9ACTN
MGGVTDATGLPHPDAILDALDPEQREAALALRGPVCILAGAGTGKTRAITHRIAYAVLSGMWKPQQVLAVTFTTRAAGEMRTRLRELGVVGVQARTFHSAALRQARYFWPQVYKSELPPIVDTKLRLVSEAANRCRVDADVAGRRDLASEIEWAKVSNVRPDDYPAVAAKMGRQVGGYDFATVSRVFAAYEEVRRDRGVIDLEDVLLCATALLADDRKVAEAIRSQYKHFVVDEYQDVSPVQQTLLSLWLGDREDVCVVGDASQTIYSFAGASPDYLLGFKRRYPSASVVRLVRDYRSTPQVVRVANGLLDAARGKAADKAVTLLAQRPDGPEPTFTEHADEVVESESIALAIAKLAAEGVPYREMAALFRINAQSEALEQALAERSIPYFVRGAERFFDRPEVRQAIVLLRGAARAAQEDETSGLVVDVRTVLGSAGWTADPPTGTGAVRERWESLAALATLADSIAQEQPAAGLAEFVAILEERAAAQHAPTADGVTLSTLHAAKGLEWDAVFLAGMHEGTMPIIYAETPEQIEEERRLLYVGVTRAREHLAVSWATARSPGQRARRSASRFLDGVRPTGSAAADRPAGVRGSGRSKSKGVAKCRVCGKALVEASDRKLGRCFDCPSSLDEALFEQLREWRKELAAEQKVPAYVIFTDATLTAIAEAKPSDRAELSRISGVGAAKLEKYGDAVLELCDGS